MTSGLRMMAGDPYFLSATNPIANADQDALETVALRLLEHPAVLKGKALAEILWRNVMAYPARDQPEGVQSSLDEIVFNFILRGVNTDGSYPRLLRKMQPAHRWFGRDIPGSRWGGDSADFVYRTLAVDGAGKYELLGWPVSEAVPTVTYTLMANLPKMQTYDLLDSLDMQFESDGSFRITIDAEPANGRPNHIQSRPGEQHLLIRDAVADWLGESPNALRVNRLDGPSADPLGDDALAAESVRQLIETIYYVYYCTQSANGQPPNALRAPMSSAAFGGMPTQWGTKSNILLGSDEALIVTTNTAGAGFRNTSLCEIFFHTVNYWDRIGTLNHAQMAADADGRTTYVIAHRDPGVHNWLDTGGKERTIWGQRWQAIPKGYTGDAPIVETKLVKLDDLEKALPEGVSRIDTAGRAKQLAERKAGFERRFIDR